MKNLREEIDELERRINELKHKINNEYSDQVSSVKCVNCKRNSKSIFCSRCMNSLRIRKIPESGIKFLKLIAKEPLGYRELMDKLNLSRERIRQLKKILLRENLIRVKVKRPAKFEISPIRFY